MAKDTNCVGLCGPPLWLVLWHCGRPAKRKFASTYISLNDLRIEKVQSSQSQLPIHYNDINVWPFSSPSSGSHAAPT